MPFARLGQELRRQRRFLHYLHVEHGHKVLYSHAHLRSYVQEQLYQPLVYCCAVGSLRPLGSSLGTLLLVAHLCGRHGAGERRSNLRIGDRRRESVNLPRLGMAQSSSRWRGAPARARPCAAPVPGPRLEEPSGLKSDVHDRASSEVPVEFLDDVRLQK